MVAAERADLVLSFAKVLYVNGQATEETMGAAGRLAQALELRSTIVPFWAELQLIADDGGARIVEDAATPAGVEMARVASAMRAIDDVAAGRLTPTAAKETVAAIFRLPPAPTWLFALAAASWLWR